MSSPACSGEVGLQCSCTSVLFGKVVSIVCPDYGGDRVIRGPPVQGRKSQPPSRAYGSIWELNAAGRLGSKARKTHCSF